MELFFWEHLKPELVSAEPVQMTIGVFDGLHRGHEALLAALQRSALPSPAPARSLVVTFRQNPKRVLNPAYPGDLMTWEEKLEAFSQRGIDQVVVIDFSLEFSKISGRDFFLKLRESFFFSKIVLGWDFSFGNGSATSGKELERWLEGQIPVEIVPPLLIDGQPVSSSRVRQAIRDGDFELATRLLGRDYEFTVPAKWQTGLWSVQRGATAKLWPQTGSYRVRINGNECILQVTEENLTWESPPGEVQQKIVFCKGVHNGFE